MKDICTFETAVKLKEAGFPQPAPEVGQWWYDNDDGRALFVRNIERNRIDFVVGRGFTYCYKFEIEKGFTYAPTATDILRAITPEDWERGWIFSPLGLKEFFENVEKIAAAWLNLKIDKLWQEMSDRIPAQGEIRDKFNSAKRLFNITKESISLLNNGDLDGMFKLFESHTTKDFPPGGFSTKNQE